MCTLKQPFEAKHLTGLALKITKGEYAPLPENLNKNIKKLIQDMLQVDSNKRPTIHDLLKNPLIKPRISLNLEVKIRKR